MSISQFRLIPNNTIQSTPGNPSGTTSTSPKMCGIALAFIPKITGNVTIMIQGFVGNTVGGDGTQFQIAYGTGTAPVNGATATGTTVGNNCFSAVIGSVPAYVHGYITGLTIGTAYWFDLQQSVTVGGTGSIQSLVIIISEVST